MVLSAYIGAPPTIGFSALAVPAARPNATALAVKNPVLNIFRSPLSARAELPEADEDTQARPAEFQIKRSRVRDRPDSQHIAGGRARGRPARRLVGNRQNTTFKLWAQVLRNGKRGLRIARQNAQGHRSVLARDQPQLKRAALTRPAFPAIDEQFPRIGIVGGGDHKAAILGGYFGDISRIARRLRATRQKIG